MKHAMGVVAFGVTLFVALMHLDAVFQGIWYISRLITPVIVGLVLAFVLNVPVSGIEKKMNQLLKDKKKQPDKGTVHMLSIVLTMFCVVLVLTILGTLVIPELVNTVKSIAELVEENWPDWIDTLEEFDINTTGIREWMSSFDMHNWIQNASGHAGTLIGSIANVATTTVSNVITAITGIIIALYVLAGRDNLARQAKKVICAYVKDSITDKLFHVCTLLKEAYTKFLTGQCLEALILWGFHLYVH